MLQSLFSVQGLVLDSGLCLVSNLVESWAGAMFGCLAASRCWGIRWAFWLLDSILFLGLKLAAALLLEEQT